MNELLSDEELEEIVQDARARAAVFIGSSAKESATGALYALFLQRALEFSMRDGPEWVAYLEAREKLQRRLDGASERSAKALGLAETS